MYAQRVSQGSNSKASDAISLSGYETRAGRVPLTRGVLFSTYCIRWPVHNKVSFDTMSCIVQSQQYLPVVGLLRQVERARVLHLDRQQSDGKAIPSPPPLGLKLLTQGVASRCLRLCLSTLSVQWNLDTTQRCQKIILSDNMG